MRMMIIMVIMKVVLEVEEVMTYGLPVGTEVLSGPINEDITLLSGQIYVLENDVVIGQDLDANGTRRNVIEPGAIILGKEEARLIVTDNGRIQQRYRR